MRARITLKDIARHAGVSPATVSLVLRNNPLAAQSTRARVQSSIDSLGYVYDRAAANLRGNVIPIWHDIAKYRSSKWLGKLIEVKVASRCRNGRQPIDGDDHAGNGSNQISQRLNIVFRGARQ